MDEDALRLYLENAGLPAGNRAALHTLKARVREHMATKAGA